MKTTQFGGEIQTYMVTTKKGVKEGLIFADLFSEVESVFGAFENDFNDLIEWHEKKFKERVTPDLLPLFREDFINDLLEPLRQGRVIYIKGVICIGEK